MSFFFGNEVCFFFHCTSPMSQLMVIFVCDMFPVMMMAKTFEMNDDGSIRSDDGLLGARLRFSPSDRGGR
jgi:hypothetical protein